MLTILEGSIKEYEPLYTQAGIIQIDVYYNGPGKDISLTKFKRQNYKNTIELAKLKLGLVNRKGYFLNHIAKAFTPYYQPLVLQVNKVRKVVFLIDRK